jgi:hypothetical protein
MNCVPLVAALLFPLMCLPDVAVKEISRDRILSAGPEWQKNYDEFQPEAERIAALRSRLGDNLRIDVYLGLWCSDSRAQVPPFLKILDAIGAPIPVRYFAVERKTDKGIRYYVGHLQVERVPTFIFYRGDRGIGRIVENPEVGLCEDMLEILSK